MERRLPPPLSRARARMRILEAIGWGGGWGSEWREEGSGGWTRGEPRPPRNVSAQARGASFWSFRHVCRAPIQFAFGRWTTEVEVVSPPFRRSSEKPLFVLNFRRKASVGPFSPWVRRRRPVVGFLVTGWPCGRLPQGERSRGPVGPAGRGRWRGGKAGSRRRHSPEFRRPGGSFLSGPEAARAAHFGTSLLFCFLSFVFRNWVFGQGWSKKRKLGSCRPRWTATWTTCGRARRTRSPPRRRGRARPAGCPQRPRAALPGALRPGPSSGVGRGRGAAAAARPGGGAGRGLAPEGATEGGTGAIRAPTRGATRAPTRGVARAPAAAGTGRGTTAPPGGPTGPSAAPAPAAARLTGGPTPSRRTAVTTASAAPSTRRSAEAGGGDPGPGRGAQPHFVWVRRVSRRPSREAFGERGRTPVG